MIIASFVLSALLQEEIDNPEYKGWKSCKPGSSVTYKFIREGSDKPGEQKVSLQSIDDKEAVTATEFTMAGKSAGKAMERKIPAKIPAAQGPQNVKEGEEEIEVAGKKMKCKTRDFQKTLSNGKTSSMRWWINEEIPGMVAKVETTTEGTAKITMIASGWEKK